MSKPLIHFDPKLEKLAGHFNQLCYFLLRIVFELFISFDTFSL